MPSVTLLHPSLNRLGGSERVCLEIMRVLKDQGHSVHLCTIDRINWALVEANWGVSTKPDKETYHQEGPLNLSGTASWAWATTTYLWMMLRAQMEAGLSVNNYGEVFPLVSDVSYIHSRPLITVEGDPYGVPVWGYTRRLYDWVYAELSSNYQEGALLTNSRYNMELVREHLGREARVVHPFIEPVLYRGEPKTGNVLTVSRIAPGKNLTLIPEVAQRMRGPRFIVAGKTQSNSDKVVSALRKRPRLDVHTNPRREDLLDLMRRSSVYLSTQPDEAFGISILEAMSAGCVPVIPRSGGPWIDILERRDGEVGLSYRDPEEAAERIREVLEDERLREALRTGAVDRSRSFTVDRFERALAEALDGIEPHGPMEGRLADSYRYVKHLRSRVDSAYEKGRKAATGRLRRAVRKVYAGPPG
ncbi:MAG: glycosyltransferase family 4 protein [Candidatus Bathyarchaeota archaeon]